MTPESRRYTAEELRHMAKHGDFSRCDPMLPEMLEQAAEDCAVLERLEARLGAMTANFITELREEVRHGR